MAAERMKFEDWEREAMALVGKSDRGWQKIAAQMLDLSEMTIVKARKREEAGPTMTRKLREAQEKAQDWTQLRGEAGEWAVSVPEERAGGDIVCEVIVTRLIEPRFNSFFQFKKDGSVVRRAEFFDTCEASVMQKMMRAAEVRAEERCKTERLAADQKGRRGEIVRLVAQQTGLDRAELEKNSTIELLAMNNKFDEETREDMQEDVKRELLTAKRDLETGAEERAFEAGVEIGQMMLGRRALELLKTFGSEAADTAAGLESAYFRRKLARIKSKRRAKEAGK